MADDFPIPPASEPARSGADCPLLEGDPEAWIVCCSHRFLPLARRISGDDALAEDVLQVSWIKVLQAINHTRFDGPKACPWVHRVVANTARDFHRKRVRRREVPLEDRRDPAQSPEALARERELLGLCREMIDLLPATYRQVLKLRLYQGLSNKQISRCLHLSRGHVAVRLNRAVALLKRRFDARIRSLSAQASQQP